MNEIVHNIWRRWQVGCTLPRVCHPIALLGASHSIDPHPSNGARNRQNLRLCGAGKPIGYKLASNSPRTWRNATGLGDSSESIRSDERNVPWLLRCMVQSNVFASPVHLLSDIREFERSRMVD